MHGSPVILVNQVQYTPSTGLMVIDFHLKISHRRAGEMVVSNPNDLQNQPSPSFS